jgi:uncharacterized membrane protein YccF (DUF307 family)
MNFIGNLIWLICGGLFSALGYLFGGIVLCLTIVGIPFGVQCFKLAGLVLAPFGRKINYTRGSFGCLNVFANIVWLIFGGIFTAINHLIWGILLFITIIGIPFARQHFKLIEVSMMPFGKRID